MEKIKNFPNNQDEYRGAEAVMRWLYGRTSGVFGAEGNAAVSALDSPAMAVQVSDGTGWLADKKGIGCVWWIDNAETGGTPLALDVTASDAIYNRIDRVIVEWSTPNYTDVPIVKILEGALSNKAAPPALTNDSTTRQISLARISVPAGTTAITSDMITDERLDPSVCGIVTDTVKVDTSVISAQFKELLDKLKKNITQTLAGQLADGAVTAEKLSDGAVAMVRAIDRLDNTDFSHFIAQAGVGGKHGNQAYAGDRWILDSGEVSYEDGVGLTLNGTIRQKLEHPPTGDVSAFVGMVSGTAEISYADGAVTITSAGGVIKWAALYEGVYTAETMPPYVPKGYSAELTECMRYYYRSWRGSLSLNQMIPTHCFYNYRIIGTKYPTPMRITPTVTLYNPISKNSGMIANYADDTDVAASVLYVNKHGFTIASGKATVGNPYYFAFEASADL